MFTEEELVPTEAKRVIWYCQGIDEVCNMYLDDAAVETMLRRVDIPSSDEHVGELKEADIGTWTRSRSLASEQQSTDVCAPSSVPALAAPVRSTHVRLVRHATSSVGNDPTYIEHARRGTTSHTDRSSLVREERLHEMCTDEPRVDEATGVMAQQDICTQGVTDTTYVQTTEPAHREITAAEGSVHTPQHETAAIVSHTKSTQQHVDVGMPAVSYWWIESAGHCSYVTGGRKHMDAYLQIVRKCQRTFPDVYSQSIEIIVIQFYLLVPCNVGGYHWIIAHIDLVSWSIHLYDPFQHEVPFEHRNKQVAYLSWLLPSMLSQAGFYTNRKSDQPICKVEAANIHMAIVPKSLVPQQSRGGNCGPRTLLLIEHTMA
ncbi:hypothetical protein Dsin_021859 [Dipteronia sinensis]|uniref:Ubiquitin-like protease family profile domain-containing protein n=1 Tax=Dipteronia sinensis TaxID=43782 RepID=A0AAE0DZI5_9ROSI|nr:hypothetical protein Dsin_021859 [Dipteronia sinensis]